jgi:hypothetical protein
MSERRTVSGRWVVFVLLAMGVIAGIAGVKYRNLSEHPGTRPTPAGATQPTR